MAGGGDRVTERPFAPVSDSGEGREWKLRTGGPQGLGCGGAGLRRERLRRGLRASRGASRPSSILARSVPQARAAGPAYSRCSINAPVL